MLRNRDLWTLIIVLGAGMWFLAFLVIGGLWTALTTLFPS